MFFFIGSVLEMVMMHSNVRKIIRVYDIGQAIFIALGLVNCISIIDQPIAIDEDIPVLLHVIDINSAWFCLFILYVMTLYCG